jgi:hypothetical protein
MSDPYWISAANAHHSESVLSKIRTDFGIEASSQSTHFCGTIKPRSKHDPMSLQTTFGLPRDTTPPPCRNRPFWQ